MNLPDISGGADATPSARNRNPSDVSRLSRTPRPTLSDTRALRFRAAWLYFRQGLTQGDIADQLGISRATVIRLLEEARRRGEVQIWIKPMPEELAGLARQLQAHYGIEEIVITPGEGTPEQTAADVGAALGQYLSGAIADGMTIGAGWGRTLDAALATFRPEPRHGVRVVSLLGGRLEAQAMNPVDFSWQMAAALGAECLLFLAPLIVDSAETRRRLLEDCGLSAITQAAETLDLAVVSCGDIGPEGSSFSRDFLPAETLEGLTTAGAICDTLCQFLDADGRAVDHAIRERVMSVDLDHVARAGQVILASGGRPRAPAIRAAILRLHCRTLITDEAAARALVELPAPTR
jgi:DNA-binding transcriptional regulator LsrR (DeoR family)